MTKKLVLRREALTELATGELRDVVGAANTITCPSALTVCGVCSIPDMDLSLVYEVTERVTRTCTTPGR